VEELVARSLGVAAAIIVSLLAVSGAGGAPTQTPKRGGTVVFLPAGIGEPRCLTPLVDVCGDGGRLTWSWIREKVLPGAFLAAPDFTARPKLVSRVPFTRKPPFTLTYHIRRAAQWSDGVPVSARDFVFTHRAVEKYAADQYPAHTMVESIRRVDSKTLRVVLRRRVAEWRLGLFPFVLPQHALAGEDLDQIWSDGIDNPMTAERIGSGPFLVESWERGEQLTLVRNPRYWGPHVAHLDRLVVRFCSAGTHVCTSAGMLEALRQGDVDVVLTRDPRVAPDLRQLSRTNVVLFPSDSWESLTLNTESKESPALGSKLVRRALAYSMDRLKIVRQLYGGVEPDYQPSQSAAFPNTSRYYEPNWSGYAYRPVLARRLLEQAGCRIGPDRIYSCDGVQLSLRFFTTAGAGGRAIVLDLLQPQLRRVGIEARVSFVVGGALFGQIMPSGDFDVVSASLLNVGGRLANKDLYGCNGPANFTGYCQRLVTANLDQADRVLDARQRARVLNRVDRQLARDVPVIPLYQPPWAIAYRKVRNVVLSADNLLWNAENWWLVR
jgi:peptide/nickel transport system substrate-binding protein